MKAPVLDFFNDEEIINAGNFLQSHPENLEKVELLKKYNIDTALLIFAREIPEFLQKKLTPLLPYLNVSTERMIYIYDKKFLLVSSPVGAPDACNLMEGLGFMGIKNFFAAGSAGQVDHTINPISFILVEKAIRDEGLSYHYLKPSVYVETDKEQTQTLASYLKKNNFEYINGTTWTTDAFFRETPKAVKKRVSQGAVCVDMECAAWCAVAKYRGYKFTQLLYFSDAVKQSGWKVKTKDIRNALRDNVIKLMVNFLSEMIKSKNIK